MAILDANTLSRIMSQALALPPDTNPYIWLSDFMATEVVPNLSTRPLRIILWLAVASHAIALLCNIAVIVFRVKAGHFWVVRFTRSEDGKYLTPNVAVAFACFGIIYTVFAIVCFCELALHLLPKLKENLLIWSMLTLPCLTTLAFLEMWSCASSLVASGSSLDSPTSNKRFPPWLFNGLCVVIPIIYWVPVLVVGEEMNLKHNQAIKQTRQLFAYTAEAADSWFGGSISLRFLQELAPQAKAVEEGLDAVARFFIIAVSYDLIYNCIVLLVWIPLVILAVRQLREQIATLQSSPFARSNQSNALQHDENTKNISYLVGLCRQRIANACIGVFLTLAYVGILLIPVSQGKSALLDRTLINVFLGGTASVFSLFGTPISIILLVLSYRSYKRTKDRTASKHSRATKSGSSTKLTTSSAASRISRTHHLDKHLELVNITKRDEPSKEDLVA